MKKLIAPSLLAANFSDLAGQIRAVESAGADMLHLDVMDGHFVPNISFGPPVISSVRSITKLPFDTHLMIENPDRYLENFRKAGSDFITVHQEACPHLPRTISRIKELGAKAGVALRPATPLSVLKDVLPDVDLVLIMSVEPGFGGQSFMPSSVKKIQELSRLIQQTGKDIHIEVDGGIDNSTASEASRGGANIFVAGTSIFRQPNIASAISALRSAVA